MMPKYVDAIEGRLKFCSTSSVIGLCNRKGNDSTSCRALWQKHVSPEEQETFLSKLHTLTAADLEEFQHKFGEAMMMRIHEVYENERGIFKDENFNQERGRPLPNSHQNQDRSSSTLTVEEALLLSSRRQKILWG